MNLKNNTNECICKIETDKIDIGNKLVVKRRGEQGGPN